jgi:hypothetical protein
MPLSGDVAMSALWLARGAVVALLAYPAGAQVIGQETAIMGGEAGFLRPSGPPAPAIVIDAMPYARTVTCSDYTLTGSAPGAGAVSWSASPSGDSGVCTGTTSWTCVINVDPDASGEGVETITVAQSGAASDTETIGFYVDGEHSCFLSQSVNGTYNSGLSNNDAVATWENLGSSALDVTQGTAGVQPTFRTSIVNGSPVVRCDGGDRLAAATAADWAFMNDSADWSAQVVYATTSSDPNAIQLVLSTQSAVQAVSRGYSFFHEDRASIPANDRARSYASNGTAAIWNIVPADGGLPAAKFNDQTIVHDNDGGAGIDATQYANNVTDGTAVISSTYSALAPATTLTVCAHNSGTLPLTGDLFRVVIYQSALDATQRGINKAVDEWALGGTLPVTP